MKGRFILAMAAAAALLLPEMAVAQRPGHRAGCRRTLPIYDSEVGVDNAPGIGGRAGLFFLPNLSVEVDWTYAEPELEDQPGLAGPDLHLP
jgi:hypothetical protein